MTVCLRRFAAAAALSLLPLLAAAPPAESCHVAARLHAEKTPPEERRERALALSGLMNLTVEMNMAKVPYELRAATPCVDGAADIFGCADVDLLAHFPLDEIGGGRGNDLWGWRHRASGREFVLFGRDSGTSFIEITDPEAPVYLGELPTAGAVTTWRDIKVYADHAFVVSDAQTDHGLQVFDLTRLLDVDTPETFDEDELFEDFASAHNIVIDEESGFAYAVGGEQCRGGLLMLDIRMPTSPSIAGCFDADGYTHDAQCLVYRGPDQEHRGRQICFASNEDTLTIVDVTDKSAPVQLSRTGYAGAEYTHQGWLTPDYTTFVIDDELDEVRQDHNTRTYIWDVSDLDAPSLTEFYEAPRPAPDHNQYISGSLVFQANYSAGLRVLRFVDSGSLEEVAFFDTVPETDADFSGAWSAYPFFENGVVVVSDMNRGLFVLRLAPELVEPAARLFWDGFETGDTSLWTSTVVRVPPSPDEPAMAVSSPALEAPRGR
ncbi:MAG: choice-of-anchor B family protein [Acidobacteriota bacterium]